MISSVTDLHFAPTPLAAENLVKEGVRRRDIFVTGNTVVDSLLATLEKLRSGAQPGWQKPLRGDGRLVLITLHRREGWQAPGGGVPPLESILSGIRAAAAEYPSVDFVFPVHHNPKVRAPVWRILGESENVQLVDPIPYLPFVDLMARATVILTDSGGIPPLSIRETAVRLRSCGIAGIQVLFPPRSISLCPAFAASTSCSHRSRKSSTLFPFLRVNTKSSTALPSIQSRSSGTSLSEIGTIRGLLFFVEQANRPCSA